MFQQHLVALIVEMKVTILFFFVVAIGVIAAQIFIGINNELTDKSTYGELQSIELARRPIRLSEPILIHGTMKIGDVLGLPTDDAHFPNAWIAVTKVRSNGDIFAVMARRARVRVSCAQVLALKGSAEVNMSASVWHFLEKNCSR